MKCIEVRENLDELLDGSAPIELARDIEGHFGDCLSCRTEFKNLRAISGTLRQIVPVSASAAFDEKVKNTFQAFHDEKRAQIIGADEHKEKTGWFGIPRFAFATAFVLLALTAISAFELGRMSASEISVVTPIPQEERTSMVPELERNNTTAAKEEPVPVRVIEVPVIREKIVTRTVYVTKDKRKEPRRGIPVKSSFAMQNSLKDNSYLTQIDLKGFQPVSDFKVRINRQEKENEK